MTPRLIGLALLALTACGPRDPGGPIAARAAELAADRVPRPIEGYCASACTMRLARDCVAPDAHLVFHPPSIDTPHWRAVMARHYPPDLAAWFMAMPAGNYAMTGAEVVGLGARGCEGG